MTLPRRHHSVPQFHLRRFSADDGRLWVWDKHADRVFQTAPHSIAVESNLYRLHEFEARGEDPLLMEKQLSEMEGQVSRITEQWLDWLRACEPSQRIEIPSPNREIVARFMAIQYLRTTETREFLGAIHASIHPEEPLPEKGRARLHTELMWDHESVDAIARYLAESIWVFAKNTTATAFLTSDNPIAFKTVDNRRWLKAGMLGQGTYAVYPLSRDLITFCHPREHWKGLEKLNECLSPVVMTDEMVESENSGQVFMASRFVISPSDDFRFARDFAKRLP
jgi:hypothetical protein